MTKKGFLAFAATAAAVAATAASAFAQDLNPPPLDWYTCQATGSGTICHGRTTFEFFDQWVATCPQGFDILQDAHHDELGERIYDRNGDLVERVLHDDYVRGHPLNVFFNSHTGQTLPYWAVTKETDAFGTPGDFDTITARQTGNIYSSVLPGAGLLVKDAGWVTFSPEGEVVDRHGPKMVLDGDVAKLCAALA